MPEEVDIAKNEHCDFLPFSTPKQVVLNEKGHIKAMEFYRMEEQDDGRYVQDEEQTIRIKADFVISAFGSGVDKEIAEAFAPLSVEAGFVKVDDVTGATDTPWIFAGGDVNGTSGTTVEAANDGKQAAWWMHKYLQGLHGAFSRRIALHFLNSC